MQWNICFLCNTSTSDFTDACLEILQSVFSLQDTVLGRTEAEKLSVTVAALCVDENAESADSNDGCNSNDNSTSLMTENRLCHWKQLSRDECRPEGINLCSFQTADSLALALHHLAETLTLGEFSKTDIFLFTEACNVRLLSALKRMQVWNGAHITLVTGTLEDQLLLSNDNELLVKYLRADVCPLSDISPEKLLPLWSGNILLTGSQHKLKLESFRLDPIMSNKELEPIQDLLKDWIPKQATCRLWSRTMHLLSFTDLRDIPHFWLTQDVYRLSLSNSRASNGSLGFLQKLISVKHSCYILRVYHSAPQALASNENSVGSAARWHQFVLNNLDSLSEEGECAQDQKYKGALSNLVVFTVPSSSVTRSDSSSSDSSSSCSQLSDWTFVACRLCNPSEVDGSLVSDVVKSFTESSAGCKLSNLTERSTAVCKGVPLLSSDTFNAFQLHHCRDEIRVIRQYMAGDNTNDEGETREDGVNVKDKLHAFNKHTYTSLINRCTETCDDQPVKSLDESLSRNVHTPHVLAERSALALRSGCRANRDQFVTGLSPPAAAKIPVIYDAAEILRHFKSYGTAAVDSLDAVPVKISNRLRHYDSMDSRFTAWPDCSQLSCHGIFYCVGTAAEELEKSYERARSRLGSHDTLSTTGSSESSLDLSASSQRGVNRLKRTRSMLDDSGCDPAVEELENASLSRQNISRQKHHKAVRCDKAVASDVSESRRSAEAEERLQAVCENSRTRTSMRGQGQRDAEVKVSEEHSAPAETLNAALVSKSKSQIRKEALSSAVFEVLEEHDVPKSTHLFSSCAKRLASILKAFIKDIAMNLNLKDEIKKLAEFHVNQVIEFEKHLRDKK